MKNIVKTTLIPALTVAAMIGGSENAWAECTDSNMPEMPTLAPQPGDDLEDSMSEYSEDLYNFFDDFEYECNGNENGTDYTVSYGVGKLPVDDPTSSQFINSLNAAYKEALLKAYENMAQRLSPTGLDIATVDKLTQQTSSGNAQKDIAVANCEAEAQKKYEEYLANKSSKTRDQTQPEPDFIHECVSEQFLLQGSGVATQLTDILNGGRIWATVYHEGYIGLVLMKSKETSLVAQVLKEQLQPASVLGRAERLVSARVKEEVAAYDRFPYGMVGTRMMKVPVGDNGYEWAVYSFGVAQDLEDNSRMRSGEAKKRAALASASELSRFSGLMVNVESGDIILANDYEEAHIVINVTKGTSTYKPTKSSSIGNAFRVAYEANSKLNLIGSAEVFSRKVKDDSGLKFRIVATAWSPSIMARNMGKRQGYDKAAEDAVSEGKYSAKGTSSEAGKRDGNKTQVIILNKDW